MDDPQKNNKLPLKSSEKNDRNAPVNGPVSGHDLQRSVIEILLDIVAERSEVHSFVSQAYANEQRSRQQVKRRMEVPMRKFFLKRQ